MKTLILTENHIKLAKRMYVGWQNCEFGAPEIDPKRPYGNRSVYSDIAEILGIEMQAGDEDFTPEKKAYMQRMHREMQHVVQIALHLGKLEQGQYEGGDYSNKWRKLP